MTMHAAAQPWLSLASFAQGVATPLCSGGTEVARLAPEPA